MSHNVQMSFGPRAPAPIATTTTNQYPIVTSKHQNDHSSTSSNSGSSSAGGYRHNPYNCENTLVYYGTSPQAHSQPCSASPAPATPQPPKVQSLQLQAYLAQQQKQNQDNGMSSANSSVHQSPSNHTYHPYYPYVAEENVAVAAYYNQDQSSFEQQRFYAATPVMTRQPPQGTMHTHLAGRLSFALYPSVAFESIEPTLPKQQMVRMFIGQLPYNVTEMQLAWILYTFGGGANMYHFERITKTDHSKGGVKVPTGCFHCHLEQEQVGPLLQLLNDRLLVDDTGIWVADSAEERHQLARYTHGMKVDKTRRFQGRPYGTVVAQVATSTFDPETFVPAKYATGGFRRH